MCLVMLIENELTKYHFCVYTFQKCSMMDEFIKKMEKKRKIRQKNNKLKVHVLKPDDQEENFIA